MGAVTMTKHEYAAMKAEIKRLQFTNAESNIRIAQFVEDNRRIPELEAEIQVTLEWQRMARAEIARLKELEEMWRPELIRLAAENEILREALTICHADFSTNPGTISSANQQIAAEFERRMHIAGNALKQADAALPTAAAARGVLRDDEQSKEG